MIDMLFNQIWDKLITAPAPGPSPFTIWQPATLGSDAPPAAQRGTAQCL